ncbi:hypothetical protein VCHA50P417_20498 [Vibrio chagasii]|nr:hypothetical protein VCHA50P417_20498 [Vibrio chagasii]
MKMIRVDANQNPILRNGKFEFVYGVDAVMQVCQHTMRVQLREYRYAQWKGVEYMNNVFTGDPNFQIFEAQSREQLELVDGVTRVIAFEYSQEDEVFEYTASIETIYGEGLINVSL